MPRRLRKPSDDEPEKKSSNVKVNRIAYSEVILRADDDYHYMKATRDDDGEVKVEVTDYSSNATIQVSLEDLGHFYEKCLEQLS